MARTRGLIEEFFVQCFINGLRDTIKNQVMMFQPTTLIEARLHYMRIPWRR